MGPRYKCWLGSYPNTFRVAKLMLYIFVLIHWNACVYFSLSNYIGFGADPWVYPNISDPEFAAARRQYFYCFWFSTLILTTVGETPPPEREEEYLFLVADMLIAVLVFASVVGSMGDVISSLRNRDNMFFSQSRTCEGLPAQPAHQQRTAETRQRLVPASPHQQVGLSVIVCEPKQHNLKTLISNIYPSEK